MNSLSLNSPGRILYTKHSIDIINVVENTISRIVSAVRFVPWIAGLLILITIGFLIAILLKPFTYYARRKIGKIVDKIINEVDSLSVRDAMEYHSEVEAFRDKLEDDIKDTFGYFVFKPVENDLRKIINSSCNLENKLFHKAYPDYDKPLTAEQNKHLSKVFESWKEEENINYY